MIYILVDTKQNLIYTPYKLRYLLHIFHKWHQLESLKKSLIALLRKYEIEMHCKTVT